MGILKTPPEYQKAVKPAVDLTNQQVVEIEQLREVLVHVHTMLCGIVDGLDDEGLMVIKALQYFYVIYGVPDMEDDAAEAAAVPRV